MWYRIKANWKDTFWTSSWMMHKSCSNKLVPIIFPAFAFWSSWHTKGTLWEVMKSFSCVRSTLHCTPWGSLPFVSVLVGWASLRSCLSIKRSVRMSMQSQTVWWECLPLVLPCCQTPFLAEGFALMMQQIRGHYPLKTCLEGCCSPHFLGWQHLQHCCSPSTGKGSGWETSRTDWMIYFKALSSHKTCHGKVNFSICSKAAIQIKLPN